MNELKISWDDNTCKLIHKKYNVYGIYCHIYYLQIQALAYTTQM